MRQGRAFDQSGVTAMDASSQVTLDTRMFGVEEDQDLSELNRIDPESSHRVSTIVKKSRIDSASCQEL